MTDQIKEWIKKQSEYAGNASCDNAETVEYYFGQGLSKGIEIAEGFVEWADENYIKNKAGYVHLDKIFDDHVKVFTTSQLLEKYIQSLDK